MNEAKFPVVVRIDGQTSYKWLTLDQANERFVVIDNRLVVNNVEPLTLEYCQFLLDQAQKSLTDLQAHFELLCEDVLPSPNNERFINEWLQPKLDKCKVDIKNAEHEAGFLRQAIDFLNN